MHEKDVNTEVSKKQTVKQESVVGSAQKRATDSSAETSNNPHFSHCERAPYELGHLLKKMPANFSGSDSLTADDRLIAEAARSHAINASDTLMQGLEALGQFMFATDANGGYSAGKGQLASLGCLISHIAIEMQFLSEVEYSIRDTLEVHDRRAATSADKSKGGK
jgi:hypothetical protein